MASVLQARTIVGKLSESADDVRLLRLAGLAIPAGVWLLGIVPAPRGGLTPLYIATFSLVLALMVLVDQTAPPPSAPAWRRFAWLIAELALSLLVVRVNGTLVRPALIYLLPASRALQMFGERRGLALSLLVWVVYGINIGLDVWPDRLHEYPNYLTFLLPPYLLAVVLTLATIRQTAERQHVQRLYDELRAAHDQLRAMHEQARQLAVTEERNRLAREIHDTVAHYLTVITLQLEAAEKLGIQQPERAVEEVRRARRLTADCLQEVRHSVGALRASSLEELSLPRALRRLAEDFATNTGIAVEVFVDLADDQAVPPEAALALYRTAQEGLTNVHRHAQATSVRLNLAVRDDHLELTIQDDGVGPGDQEQPAGSGFGLLGLRERVELLGGHLMFGPAVPSGSRLAAVIPSGDAL